MEKATEETSEPQGAALSLERYAEVVAHLLYFRKANPFEVIEQLGIEATDWKSAERAWTRAIGDELERQETALAQRLAEALAVPRQRLEEVRPTLESIGPLASERVEAPAPVVKLASFAPVEASSVEAAAPVALEAPGPVPKVSPAPSLPTYALSAAAPERGGFPAGLAAWPSSSEAGAPAMKRGPRALATTSPVSDVPHGPVVPFGDARNADPAHALDTPIAPAGVAQGSRSAVPSSFEAATRVSTPGPSALKATSLALDVPRGPVMPFVNARSADPMRGLDTSITHAGSVHGPGPAVVPEQPIIAATEHVQRTTPEASPAAFPLERYASICVELEMYGDRAAEVLARYHLTAADKAALDERYRLAFTQRPGEWSAFQQACASYKTWLRETQTKR